VWDLAPLLDSGDDSDESDEADETAAAAPQPAQVCPTHCFCLEPCGWVPLPERCSGLSHQGVRRCPMKVFMAFPGRCLWLCACAGMWTNCDDDRGGDDAHTLLLLMVMVIVMTMIDDDYEGDAEDDEDDDDDDDDDDNDDL
jgi:hypothetical protein